MEGAARVFAGELNRSTLTIRTPGAGETRAVVTPSGAVCTRIYLSGALTGVLETAGTVQLRISDPTGVFELVVGSMQAELLDLARKIPQPSFLSAVGKVQIYQRQGSSAVSLRPESFQVTDRGVRDAWVVRTADMTLDRLAAVTGAVLGQTGNPLYRQVVNHYQLTPERIRELVEMVQSALSTVRLSGGSVQPPPDPQERILALIREHQGVRGIPIGDVVTRAVLEGIAEDTAQEVIRDLLCRDECYQPQKGMIKLL